MSETKRFERLNYVPMFWYLSNNFGDSLNHYMIKKMSGNRIPVWVEAKNPCEKIMAIGSILNNEVENAIVWGSGVAFSTDIIPPKTKILAVRGKLTGKLCEEQEVAFDKVYGDPCMILPRLYTPKVKKKKYKLGIIPHYIDTKTVCDRFGVGNERLDEHKIKIINILDEVEDFVDSISECDKIISSTLHGLIVSNAYGIPAQWVKFSDNIGGDDFKYRDYYSLTDKPDSVFWDFRNEFTLNKALEIAEVNMELAKFNYDEETFYNCCPFKF